jgi:hypothetical protein
MFPNKVISVSESIIWKFPLVLEMLQKQDMSVDNLWKKTASKFDDINHFIICLDALYLLEKIEYNDNYEVLTYVKGN